MMSYINYFNSYRNGRTEMHDINAVFDTRRDAVEALSALLDILDKYAFVTVADVYDCIGESCDYRKSQYGWTDLRGTEIIRSNGRYVIHFRTNPHLLDNDSIKRHCAEPKPEPEISVDILVTINGKKYKLVPVDDE